MLTSVIEVEPPQATPHTQHAVGLHTAVYVSSIEYTCVLTPDTGIQQQQQQVSAASLLQTLLVPFFRRSLGGGGYEAGPFFSLSPACQHAAVSLIYYMAPLSEGLLAALAAAVVLPEVAEDVMKRSIVYIYIHIYIHIYIRIYRHRYIIYMYIIYICLCCLYIVDKYYIYMSM